MSINLNRFLFFPLDAPKTFLSSKRLKAEEKQNVTIACTASGQPQPRVRWFKPCGTLPKDRTEMVNGTLKIYNVAKTDGGTYLCKAENVMGAETATALVVIFFPLRFKVRPPQELTPLINYSPKVLLPCLAESELKTTITWTKDGKSSLPEDSDVLQNGTLVLRNINKSHGGSYTCRAANALKTVEANVKINSPITATSCSVKRKYVGGVSGKLRH